MAQCAKAVAPLAYEAFEEHVLNGVRFSQGECKALLAMLDGNQHDLEGRSLAIFEAKLEKMRRAHKIEEPEEPALP
jgi:thymidylate synthase (FAD)